MMSQSQNNKNNNNFDFFTNDNLNSQSDPFFDQPDRPYNNNNNSNPSNFSTMKPLNNPNFGQNQNQFQQQKPMNNLYSPQNHMKFGINNQMDNNDFNQNSMTKNINFSQHNVMKDDRPSPRDFMTTVNMQSTNNATGKFGNMLAQPDPFASADVGYNAGSLSSGFKTMAPGKTKRKNPFSKASNNDNQPSIFQSSSHNQANAFNFANGPQEFSDMFSSSANTSSAPYSNPMQDFGTPNSQYNPMQDFATPNTQYNNPMQEFNNPYNESNPNMFKTTNGFDNQNLNMHRGTSFGMNNNQPQQQQQQQTDLFEF